MGKRSKNNMVNSTPPRSKKKFLLEVVLQLEKLESAKLVSEYLGISKQRLNYYLNKLKRLEIVEKRGYGVWAVNRNNFYLLDQDLLG
jgi:Fic family protein